MGTARKGLTCGLLEKGSAKLGAVTFYHACSIYLEGCSALMSLAEIIFLLYISFLSIATS